VLEGLNAVREVAIARASEHAGVVMPGYTHLQSAQPITYGHYLAALADALARDARRIEVAMEGFDACPLGAGAIAGTAFPIQRQETARLLGFSGCVGNSLDAVASRDFAWELMSSMAIAA
ncbi:lyase family protein, partial [Paracidovorax avenae]